VRFTETPLGLEWIAPEPPPLDRASHALVDGGRVWLVDPVGGDVVLERVRALGEPAGVLQLLDRHDRDGAALASQLGVPHHRLPFEGVPGAPFDVVPVVRGPIWNELALWWPQRRALVVADALGTARYYRAPEEPLAVHPILRLLRPPRVLGRFAPEHVLVGHGEGVHADATRLLRAALDGARGNIVAWARARLPI